MSADLNTSKTSGKHAITTACSSSYTNQVVEKASLPQVLVSYSLRFWFLPLDKFSPKYVIIISYHKVISTYF